MSKICYWDSATNSQKERDCTPEEELEISARKAPKDPTIIKAEIWEEIKKYRDNLVENGGFKVGSNWYHSSALSRTQYLSLVMMGANIPANTQWKTMENGYVPMTQTLASQIFAAGAAQDKALFEKAAEHRALMEASNDPANYNWKTGWPETFTG